MSESIPAPGGGRADRAALHWGLLIFGAAIFVFSPALRNEPVFDDVYQLERLERAVADGDGNYLIEGWWPPDRQKYAWRPVTRLALAVEFQTGKTLGLSDPRLAVRLSGIALHALASVLLFSVMLRWGLGVGASGAAALLLAVHPMRSEAVHQVVGQSELIAACLILGGLRIHQGLKSIPGQLEVALFAQGLCFALALGAKEHAVLYPLYLALADLASPGTERGWRRRLPGITLHALALAVPLGLYLFLRWRMTGGLAEPLASIPGYENVMARMSFMGRLPAALGLFAYSVLECFVPLSLSPDYSALSLPLGSGWAWPMAWLGLLLILGVVIASYRSFRAGGRGWIMAVAGIAAWGFTSNLILTTGVVFALRLTYLPMMAFGIALAAMIGRLQTTQWMSANRRAGGFALGCAALLLASISWGIAPVWLNEIEFGERTVKIFPDCWRGHHNLARQYYMNRNFEKGIAHAGRAVDLRRDEPMSWDYLGLNASQLPEQDVPADAAETAFHEAIRLDPLGFRVYVHLAHHLRSRGRRAEAEAIMARCPPDYSSYYEDFAPVH